MSIKVYNTHLKIQFKIYNYLNQNVMKKWFWNRKENWVLKLMIKNKLICSNLKIFKKSSKTLKKKICFI
jgi:hypothetical protein